MNASEFRTSDLALCAYLKSEGYGYTKIEVVEEPRWDEKRKRQFPGRAEMVFEDTEGLRDAVMDYQTGNARVEPRDFQQWIGWVRGRLLDAVRPSE